MNFVAKRWPPRTPVLVAAIALVLVLAAIVALALNAGRQPSVPGVRVSHLVDAIGQPRGIDRPLITRFFSLLFQTFTVAVMLGADFLGALG